jgi:hypothetical protein
MSESNEGRRRLPKLTRETLRSLTGTELSVVAGGGARATTRCR